MFLRSVDCAGQSRHPAAHTHQLACGSWEEGRSYRYHERQVDLAHPAMKSAAPDVRRHKNRTGESLRDWDRSRRHANDPLLTSGH